MRDFLQYVPLIMFVNPDGSWDEQLLLKVAANYLHDNLIQGDYYQGRVDPIYVE